MKSALGRTVAVVATALLLGGVAAPAGAASARIPWEKPVPMPEGSGYSCWADQERKSVNCSHVSWGVRWKNADQSRGCEFREDGWSVCIAEIPDRYMQGNMCDVPENAARSTLCQHERETGQAIPDSARVLETYRLQPAWPGGMWAGTPGWMFKGEWLISKNRRFGLTFQPDGNLVAYGPNRSVVWHSGTWGNPGANFVMQPDGNAVIYAPDGRALWSTGTWGNPQSSLDVRDDGSVIIRRGDGSAAWASPAAR